MKLSIDLQTCVLYS